MKKVSERRKGLKGRTEALSNTSRKFRMGGIILALLGMGIYLGGYVAGSFLYWFGFGLLLFSLFTDILVWRMKKKFKAA